MRASKSFARKMSKAVSVCAVMMALGLVGSPAPAQEDGWQKDLSIYLWTLALDGDMVVRGVPAEVDASFSDVLENLDLALTAHFELKKDRWMMLFDLNYSQIAPATPDLIQDLDVEFAILELAGGYRVKEPLHVLFGVRYVSLDIDLTAGGLPVPPPLPSPSAQVQGSQSWVDPYVGLRLQQPMSEKWNFIGRADIGGFGVGSDFAWNVALLFQRNLTRRTSLLFGAGVLDIDYDDGEGSERFAYNVRHDGLLLAFNFSF